VRAGHETRLFARQIGDGGLTIGQRHAWDKESPGMFDALVAMEEAAKAGAPA
jgi:hypothetical protein